MNNIDNYENFVVDTITENLYSKIDDIFIEALKLKGYTFSNHIELIDFTKKYCSCVDNHIAKQKIYSVESVPFLMHDYNSDIDFDFNNINTSLTVSAQMGSFHFL